MSINILRCPRCKGDHTHFTGVLMFTRPLGEGKRIQPFHVAPNGTISFPEFGYWSAKVDESIANGPRRDTEDLLFTCETCRGDFCVVYRQVKGQTHVETTVLPSDRYPA